MKISKQFKNKVVFRITSLLFGEVSSLEALKQSLQDIIVEIDTELSKQQ